MNQNFALTSRCFFIILACFFVTLATAQSRKELLAQVQVWKLKELQWKKDSLRQKADMETQNKEIATLSNTAEVLKKEKEELQQNTLKLQQNIVDLQIKNRRQVEVYDLYSFGYQPLKNSTKEYEDQLKVTQKAIETARWKNVGDLLIQLNSKKITDEQKLFLFNGLLLIYPSFSTKNMLDFIPFSDRMQVELKGIIQQQTQKELKSMMRENLWIQTLEENWDPLNNPLIIKYQ